MRFDLRRAACFFVSIAAVVLAACGSASSSSDGTNGGTGPATGTSPGGVTPPLATPQNGVATFYDGDGSGACSFPSDPNDLDFAAMDAAEWDTSAACGACANVVGPNGTVTVRITDLCPGCEAGHLDLSRQAFAKIASLDKGRVPITWTLVACGVSGNVAYHYKDGSSQWWTAVQVRNHRLPIAKLEWKKDGAWVPVARESYNYFVEPGGMGTSPVSIRITAWSGETLEDTIPAPASELDAQGASQF